MKAPDFVKMVGLGLVFDIVLVLMLPFMGELSLLLLFTLVPLSVAAGVWKSLEWARTEAKGDFWSGLSRLLLPSSLLYLLITTALVVLGPPDRGSELYELLLYAYLLIVSLRFYMAAFPTMFLTLPCFFLGRGGFSKLNSVAALLCSLAAFSIQGELMKAQTTAFDWFVLVMVGCVAFSYCLVCGSAVQWGIGAASK